MNLITQATGKMRAQAEQLATSAARALGEAGNPTIVSGTTQVERLANHGSRAIVLGEDGRLVESTYRLVTELSPTYPPDGDQMVRSLA